MCGGPEHSKFLSDSKHHREFPDGLRSNSNYSFMGPSHTEAAFLQSDRFTKDGMVGVSSSISFLELAAMNDVNGLRVAVEEHGAQLDGGDYWYVRGTGTGRMALQQRTALMIAALYGNIEVMNFLLDRCGVDVNAVCGEDLVTALHCAASGGSARADMAVSLLIKHGARKDAVNCEGQLPLDVIRVPLRFATVKSALQVLLSQAERQNGRRNGDEIVADDHGLRKDDDEMMGAAFNRKGQSSVSSVCSSPTSLSPPMSPKFDSPTNEGERLKDYPAESPLPDIKNSIYTTDEFRMFSFKVRPCSRAYSHDWTECPFVHPGENARRRDPRRYHYSCVPCPDFRKGACRRGDACEYAHGVFECWLHPAQYRTRLCKDGVGCARRVCFFAHTSEELRPLQSMGSAVQSPRPSSPLDPRSLSPPLTVVSPSSSIIGSPFSPSNVPSPGNGLCTPPLSPSASSLSCGWSQPSVPALHLPGGVSRLRAALSARDMKQFDDYRTGAEVAIDGHLANEFGSLTVGRQNAAAAAAAAVLIGSSNAVGSGRHKFASLGLNIPQTNLQDLFSSEAVSPLSVEQQQHQQQQQQIQTQLHLQQLLSPTIPQQYGSNNNNSPQSMFAMGGCSPRAIPRRCDSSELHSAFGNGGVDTGMIARSFAQRDRGAWSSRDMSGSVSPSCLSDWGSPSGKPDWGMQGDDIGKFRKSASFAASRNDGVGSGGAAVAEPDVSWVQTLVKEGSSSSTAYGSEEQ